MTLNRVVGAKRIAIPDRGILPPPVEPPPAQMEWISLNVEINFQNISVSAKTNPVVIQPIAGQVRLRTIQSGVTKFSDKSVVLGPGTSNQPTGLQCTITGLTYGVPVQVQIKVFSSDLGAATDSDWEDLVGYSPFPSGPFEIPLTSA